MPGPTSRDELVIQVTSSYEKLVAELDGAGSAVSELTAVDDWSVKDLLAVRAWWTARLTLWIAAGREGKSPAIPDRGYKWSETPRLNADVVGRSRDQSYQTVRRRLEKGYEQVLATIDELADGELLDAGVYSWAGKWPVSRWISINATRQYITARTHVRAALRQRLG